MDSFKRLLIEYNGINKTICSYDEKSTAANILPELKVAMDCKDKESIAYCLETICNWYEKNIIDINNNHFELNINDKYYVENLQEHYHYMSVVKELKDSMKDYIFETEKTSELTVTSEPIIFLSHRSSDKKYGDALRNFIISLGVREEQLIYTSHPLHKIPLDRNIYDYLRENITKNVFMIILWSDDYLESPACLNEMGAAWVVQSDYTNIYVPTFSFGNPKYHECAIDTRKMGAILNGDKHCRASILELKKRIEELFGLHNDEKKTMYILDKFIEEINDDYIQGIIPNGDDVAY